MPPIKKTIVGLQKNTETALVRLLTNQPGQNEASPPFPDSLGGGKSASQKHQEFLEALLSGDPAQIEDALKNQPATHKIMDDGEVARITHIVQSFYQQPGGQGSVGLQVYAVVKAMIAQAGQGPDPTFW